MDFGDRESKHPQGSDEWLVDRYGCLSGSTVGEIMPGKRGGVPSTRKKMLYKKTIEHVASVDESQPIPKRYADWGHEWEAEACRAVEDYLNTNGELTDKVKFREVNLIKSDFNDLVASSLDRIDITHKYALEVKCPFYMSSHIKHITEKPALNCASSGMEKNYYWQPRQHMLVTGAEWCIWASYHPHFTPRPLYIEIIQRDEEEMKQLKEACESFIVDMKKMCKEVIK